MDMVMELMRKSGGTFIARLRLYFDLLSMLVLISSSTSYKINY